MCLKGMSYEGEQCEDTNPQSLAGPRDSHLYLMSSLEASKSSITGEQEGSICIL